MFDALKKNIEQEKKIIMDMHSIESSMQTDQANKAFYTQSLQPLAQQLQLLNKAVPSLLKEWSPLKKFMDKEGAPEGGVVKPGAAAPVAAPAAAKSAEAQKVVTMSYVSPSTKEKRYITINEKDKKGFLEKLKMSEKSLQGLDVLKKKKDDEKNAEGVRKPNPFVVFANKYFLKYSEKLAPKFPILANDLKKSNMGIMLTTYVSIILLSSVLAFFAGILIYALLVVASVSNIIHIWIPFAAVGGAFFFTYTYPGSEAATVKKKIIQELPFVTIHMSAIAGSNIEPTKIFKIIAASKEYPTVGSELRKIVSQIEIYGYDLVTSLKNVASRTPSKELGELLSGLATNISTGGELKTYLDQKAVNFLMDYKLEREKYADLAGTFMDVYISILIAAPLVLMMLFIVMDVAGMGMGGMGITSLLFISIGGIAIANIVFLVVLTMKQPAV